MVAWKSYKNNLPFHIRANLLIDVLSTPKKTGIHKYNLKTLNDFQKLMGDINWLCPSLKHTICELSPLFKILQGDTQPSTPI
jgi:hypothetical protein